MIEYPDYWYCKCGHNRSEHRFLNPPMCKERDINGNWVDACTRFEPMDNLSLIEYLAKQKGILEEQIKV